MRLSGRLPPGRRLLTFNPSEPMKIRFALAIAAVAVSWILPAAGAPEPYRVRVLTLQPAAEEKLHIHSADGKATAGVVSPKNFLNHEYETLETKGGAVVLSKKAEPSSAKVEEDVVGTFELPGKPGSYILFLMPDPEKESKSKVVVVDSSAKSFPPGSFKVVNLSSVPVKIELEGKPFDFPVGETKLIEKAPMGERQSAAMKASYERDGKKQTITTGAWPDPGKKRVLQVILESGSNKRVEIRGFRDVAAP